VYFLKYCYVITQSNFDSLRIKLINTRIVSYNVLPPIANINNITSNKIDVFGSKPESSTSSLFNFFSLKFEIG